VPRAPALECGNACAELNNGIGLAKDREVWNSDTSMKLRWIGAAIAAKPSKDIRILRVDRGQCFGRGNFRPTPRSSGQATAVGNQAASTIMESYSASPAWFRPSEPCNRNLVLCCS
jgi:hypothetical protein